jgi:hypothetical protein
LALGIVTSGSSVGGVVWPIMINHLIINVGKIQSQNFVEFFLPKLSGWIWMGAPDLWVYRSCYDRWGCSDGESKTPTEDGPGILCFPSLQTTGVRLLMVGYLSCPMDDLMT